LSSDELLRQVQVQAAAARELEGEQRQSSTAKAIYSNAEQRTASGQKYEQIGASSIAQGTSLAGNFDPNSGEVVWAETWDTGQPGSELAEKIQCANGTDCLFSDVCYGWYECDPCDWCENNTCVPRDENRPCGATWECPCQPNDRQHYECVDTACKLTCTVNGDCAENEVCDLKSGFCEPGCEHDRECDPSHPDAAGDAQKGTFCENYECVFPCDKVRYCKTDDDCNKSEYCGEREFFVESDTEGETHQCLGGCRLGKCKDEQGEVDLLNLLEEVQHENENRNIIKQDLAQYSAGLADGSTTQSDVEAVQTELAQNTLRVKQLTEAIEETRYKIELYEARAVCDEESRSCYIPCAADDDCAADESCEEGKCESAGLICVTSSDCEEGEFCNPDGRCAGGCEDDDDCTRECTRDQACIQECPPIGNCTCEGDGCYNPNWIELCPRDPDCIEACPVDPACLKYNRKAECISNKCEQTCSNSGQCSEGDICKDGLCMQKEADPVTGEPADDRLGCDCGDVCNQFGTCEVVICNVDEDCPSCSICEEGVCIEGCSDENPCPSGGCCNPDGRCSKSCSNDFECASEPGNQKCLEGGCCGLICDPLVPCISTSDCEAGQYCGDENYCLEGCLVDADCAALTEDPELIKTFREVQLELHTAQHQKALLENELEQLKVGFDEGTVTQAEVDAKQTELDDFVPVVEGLQADFEYYRAEVAALDRLYKCSKNFVQAPNGAIAPCEYYPNEECFSEIGQCVEYCLSDNDCAADEHCVDEQCQANQTYCDNDNGCEAGEICKDHICTFGCRFNSQCEGDNERCVDNQCKLTCNNDEVCKAVRGESGFCRIDRNSPFGICDTVNTGTKSEGGHKGCECYEFCDKDGYCTPFVCDSDLDCQDEACGSCLVGNVCGECLEDEDCPGVKICDNKDEKGKKKREPFTEKEAAKYKELSIKYELLKRENAPADAIIAVQRQMEVMYSEKPYLKGLCAYPCTPGGPTTCIRSKDCEEGFYCDAGQCTRGCAENEDCNPSQVCRGEKCVDKCNEDRQDEYCLEDQDCRFDEVCRYGHCTTCLEDYHYCIEGGCQFRGPSCNPENDKAKAIQEQIDYFKNKSEPNEKDAKRIEALEYKKAQILELDDGDEKDLKIEHVQAQIDHIKGQYTPLTEEEEQQLKTLEKRLEEAKNIDCPEGQECNSDTCEPKPVECLADFECTYPEVCAPMGKNGELICYEEPSDQSYAAFDPNIIGCESCADYCAPEGVCKPQPCLRNDDCNCGICGGGGFCLERCQTDVDCGGGRCRKGECIECISNFDCVRQYGEGTLCNEGKCDTPCYTGLSTGDCFEGLNDGDTCHSCPDKCPIGAPCRKVDEVCNVEEVYDVLQERTKVHITQCVVCRNSCITSSDCEDGTVCGGFGYCRPTDGRCTYDSDCAEEALQSNKELVCSNNTCIEAGVTCFTNTDCDEGEVCDNGKCVVGECGSADTCPQGKVCNGNQCVWQCGPDSEVFLCGDGGNCPPGFYCSADETIGGYCLRPGVTLSTVRDPECATGEICCDGGCLPKVYGKKECCSDKSCKEGYVCCDGLCKWDKCDQEPAVEPGLEENADKEEQDNCERIGKCCGADGYCEPCGCDENNPCQQSGECCDRDTGQCISVSLHPNTKYGSPDGCTIDRVFCELYNSEDEPQQIVPEELGDDRFYRACEIIDPVTEEVRCVEGGKRSEFQIVNLLKDACFVPKTKECKCDDIPEVDECVNDDDCGPCADCYTKRFWSDACCGIYGEGEITSSTGYDIPTGLDWVDRKICKEHPYKETPEECGCRSDDDCTECEYCDGGNLNKLGKCRERCEELCPCGGPLSKGKECKTCQQRHGPCAVEGLFTTGEEYIDPITGELIQPPSQCACILDRQKECCKGFNSIDELKRRKTKCLESTTALVDGTIAYNRTDKCLDPQKDICAQCTVDAHCPGNQRCEGYQCVTECGSANSNPGEIGQADGQDLGDVGGNPYNCYCCSRQGDCRSKFETWVESTGAAKGPWNFTYYLNEDPNNLRTYYSSKEHYGSAVSELKRSWPKSTLTIVNADGEEQTGNCRPCNCTENGIQCGAWAPCKSCFEWQKRPDVVDVGPTTEVMRVEGKIKAVTDNLNNFEETYQERLIDLENAAAAYKSAIVQQRINHGLNENAATQLEELRESYYDEIEITDEELAKAKKEVLDLEDKLELAYHNEKLLDAENLELQLSQSIFERDALQDRSDELDELLEQNTEDVEALVEDLPSVSQLELESRRNDLEYHRKLVRQSHTYISQQQQLIRNLQHDLARVQNPSNVYYEQVRVCGCCMEGTCRPEEECTYGTCYLCVTEYDNRPGKAFNAQLYGKVIGNIISPDSPDRTGEEEMTGKFRWDYQLEKDTCVKYDCAQPYYVEQRPGIATQGRYWEYCIGGLMSCINQYWEGHQYRQGWVYEVDLSEAGTYFTTDYENWVKMGKYSGRDWPNTSKCLHDNDAAGALGFNTMVTFEDLVAGHPICNKAELVHGCTPGNEGCGATYDTYYESGAPDLIIQRMQLELQEMNALIAWLEGYIEYVKDFIKEMNQEIENRELLLEQLEEQIDLAIVARNNARREVRRLENVFKNTDGTKEAVDNKVAEAKEAFDTEDQKLTELQEKAQEKQTNLDAQKFIIDTTMENLRSATYVANNRSYKINDLKQKIAELKHIISETDPLASAYPQLEVDLLNFENDLAIEQEEYSTIVGDMLEYEETIKLGRRLIGWNTCDLPEDYTESEYEAEGKGDCESLEEQRRKAAEDVEAQREPWTIAEEALAEARAERDQWVDDRENIFADLDAAKSILDNAEDQLKTLNEKAGLKIWKPDLCREGYGPAEDHVGNPICCEVENGQLNCGLLRRVSRGAYERECKAICEEIKNFEHIIYNVEGQQSELETLLSNTKDAKKDKTEELHDLIEKDENATPPFMTGPVKRPDGTKNAKELMKEMKQNMEIDKYLQGERKWPPGRR